MTNKPDLDKLSGQWKGNWGEKNDIIFDIQLHPADWYINGFYMLNKQKTFFKGKVTSDEKHGYKLEFFPPMSQGSGGYYDPHNERLMLFCDAKSTRSGQFHKVS